MRARLLGAGLARLAGTSLVIAFAAAVIAQPTTKLHLHYRVDLTGTIAIHGTYDKVIEAPGLSCASYAAVLPPQHVGLQVNGHDIGLAVMEKAESKPGTVPLNDDVDHVAIDYDANGDVGVFSIHVRNGSGSLTFNRDGSGRVELRGWANLGEALEEGAISWTCASESAEPVADRAVVERGGTVTLSVRNAKAGVRYEWTFAGEPDRDSTGCAPRPDARREATTMTVTLLCSVRATLRATPDDGAGSKSIVVRVTPRRWKTAVVAGSSKPLPARDLDAISIDDNGRCLACDFGKNRCARDDQDGGADDKNARTQHVIHKKELLWLGTAYQVKQVADEPGSPFAGYWFADKASFEIQRNKFINPRWLDKELDRANAKQSKWAQSLVELREEIDAHEEMHTTLYRERLQTFQAAGQDPAQQIERLVVPESTGADALTADAEVALSKADATLADASSETAVKERLRQDPRWQKGGALLVNSAKQWRELQIPAYWDLGGQ